MGTNIIITLLMTIFSIGFPLQVLAQEQQAPRSGFSPYVFVTLSSEGERNIPHQNLFGAHYRTLLGGSLTAQFRAGQDPQDMATYAKTPLL
jgi:hypothetical protein